MSLFFGLALLPVLFQKQFVRVAFVPELQLNLVLIQGWHKYASLRQSLCLEKLVELICSLLIQVGEFVPTTGRPSEMDGAL